MSSLDIPKIGTKRAVKIVDCAGVATTLAINLLRMNGLTRPGICQAVKNFSY